ncbi:MAG: hypothetical protein ABW185_07190 [Sedimenticola sp.]
MSKKDRMVSTNDEDIIKMKNEIKEKQSKISELEAINEAMNDPIVATYYNGRYVNEIRETIMTLILECGISQGKVNKVMEVVVKNLTGKTLDRLPSTGVKSRLVTEGKRVAQRQVAVAMLDGLEDPSVGNCLHQDGTTKFHRHFQSFQVTTAEKRTYSLGMSEVSAGDAETLLSAFKTQLDELADAIHEEKGHETVAKLVASITSTMSDQGSVNPVFHSQLADLKSTLLPDVFANWETMDPDVRSEVSTISSYFCKMHIFVNMASEVDKCLSVFGNNVTAGKNPYSFDWNESSATRLTRTASKGLTMHGCDKSGVGSHFSTYLQSNDKVSKLITFRGHRFNHLFYAAGATYHHAKDIQNFLDTWPEPNGLLKSLSFDIREKVSLCGIRALGIVDKLITGPLWRLIEKTGSILDLNPVLHHLQVKLEEFSKDSSPLLAGIEVFPDMVIHKDEVFTSLFQSRDAVDETYTQMALELVAGGMLLILERQAKDQLPGGKYFSPDQVTQQKASNVPTTNTCSERDFAQLDILMRTKPSAGTVAYESIIMWTNNKTSHWLNSLSSDAKEEILNDARVSAPQLLSAFRAKQTSLYEKKLLLLRKRQEQKVQKEGKLYSQNVKLTKKLNNIGGLWLSEEDINVRKESLTKGEYKDAIISQLQFRKKVLHSKGPKEKFQQVCKGKTYSIEELEENLRHILVINAEEENEEEEQPHLSYIDVEEAAQKIEASKSSLVRKIKEGRNKILIKQQSTRLPGIISQPELLVGKKIKHKCRDPDTNEIAWYAGFVCSIHSLQGKKSEYFVSYEDDDGEWRMPLLTDMEKGDLILLD